MTLPAVQFSDQTYRYFGDRPVKAAWRITTPAGDQFHGWSLTPTLAYARAKQIAARESRMQYQWSPRGAITPRFRAHRQRIAKNAGFATWRDHRKSCRSATAAFVERCTTRSPKRAPPRIAPTPQQYSRLPDHLSKSPRRLRLASLYFQATGDSRGTGRV